VYNSIRGKITERITFMEQQIIEKTALKKGISPDAVIREYYEYLLLSGLFESEIGDNIVFKGGTALRVFYGLPRYSDDLDFDITGKKNFKSFSRAVRSAAGRYENMQISDLWEKKNTFQCEIKIEETWMKQKFSVKIEASKRTGMNGRKSELKMAVSDDFGTQVFGRVMTLESLYEEKSRALSGRDEPKDYFDMWYICQLLKKPFNPGKKPDKKRYRQVLGKYLPRKYVKVLDEIL